jgi:hypothetical protein
MHLDFPVENEEEESRRLEQLGAKVISKHQNGEMTWRVLADPEGNEFCISKDW